MENGATNVVFPITVIALAFSLLIGDGGAAYLSLKLGEGDMEHAQKGVGNALVMVTIVGFFMMVITLVFLKPIVTFFGATDKLLPFALDYGYIIALGLPFTMIATALNSIIRADGSPQFAMISMILGAAINTILDPIFIFPLQMGVKGAAIATILRQIISFVVSAVYVTNNLLAKYGARSIYGAEIPITAMGIVMKVNQIMISVLVGIAAGSQPIIGYNYGAGNYGRVKKTFLIATSAAEEGLYNEFAVKCFRIFLLFCILNGFQTVASIYLQAVGKPGKAALVSLSRQIVFLVPAAIILPIFMNVEGILWSGPVADCLAFILAFVIIAFEMKHLNCGMKPQENL